jgi:uncharacterized protein
MNYETVKQSYGPVDNSNSQISRLKTIPVNAIKVTGGFWKRQQSIIRRISLAHAYRKLEEAGNFENLRIAARRKTGGFRGINFYDEDVYKWLEALGWELTNEPDPVLQRMADEVIVLITAAQLPDGYLNSYYQTEEPDKRWADLDFGHELYCAGHLFQAAIAFQRGLGDRRLLDVACRFADHINTIFGPQLRHGTSGHPEVEMALVELYRETGKIDYLDLAKFFIDQRGKKHMRGMGANGPEYHQDHVPVREATAAAGHAVRQMYLLTGIADIYMERGEQALWDVSERLWKDITRSKMYITGGVGSRYDGESFGEPYELPPDQCYCETCAAIGSLMWHWRLLLLTGDGRYADVIERTLFNGILSSPALDGKHFFYVNPLMIRSGGSMRHSTNRLEEVLEDGRPEWHEVACCPPNVMRLFSSLSHYLVTTKQNGVQIHQYATSTMALSLGNDRLVRLELESDYPWKGDVRLKIDQDTAFSWMLSLRLPGWCQDFTVLINGNEIAHHEIDQGYLVIKRTWSPGDIVDLQLSMPPVLVYPHPRIDAVRGCAALTRGPLLYCFEEHDQLEGFSLLDMVMDSRSPMRTVWREDVLGGINTIEIEGWFRENESEENDLYQFEKTIVEADTERSRMTSVPYYAWGNRGLKSMRVWVPVQ